MVEWWKKQGWRQEQDFEGQDEEMDFILSAVGSHGKVLIRIT